MDHDYTFAKPKDAERPLCPFTLNPCKGRACALSVATVSNSKSGDVVAWHCGLVQVRDGYLMTAIDHQTIPADGGRVGYGTHKRRA